MTKLSLFSNLTSFSQLIPIAPHRPTMHYCKEPGCIFWINLKLLLLQAKQAQFSQAFLTGQVLWFLTIVVALCWTHSNLPVSLLNGRAPNWIKYSRCGLINAEQREIITSLDLLAMLLLVHPSKPIPLACLGLLYCYSDQQLCPWSCQQVASVCTEMDWTAQMEVKVDQDFIFNCNS